MKVNKKGFTLIELIIVVIIIGILAAIAAPMMSANVVKARKSEAVAALGTLRTAQRIYFADQGAYPAAVMGSIGTSVATMNAYVNAPDLNAQYFNNTSYGIDGSGASYADCTKSTDSGVRTAGGTINLTAAGALSGN